MFRISAQFLDYCGKETQIADIGGAPLAAHTAARTPALKRERAFGEAGSGIVSKGAQILTHEALRAGVRVVVAGVRAEKVPRQRGADGGIASAVVIAFAWVTEVDLATRRASTSRVARAGNTTATP
jgi:hypothetical protein